MSFNRWAFRKEMVKSLLVIAMLSCLVAAISAQTLLVIGVLAVFGVIVLAKVLIQLRHGQFPWWVVLSDALLTLRRYIFFPMLAIPAFS